MAAGEAGAGSRRGLDAGEQREAVKRSAVAVQVVHEAIRLEGEEELGRPTGRLAWSAVAGGLSMGFSLVAEALLRSALPDAPWRPLVAKLGYTVGFLLVILARQQLFTEQTLTVILPALAHRSLAVLPRIARVWAVVLLGNVLGALVFAWLAGLGDVFSPELKDTFHAIAAEAMAPSFATKLWRAVFGGWLIALTVWLLPAAANARVLVVVIITYLVGLGGFTHTVAGSVEGLYLVTHHDLSLGRFLADFLLPAFLGNALGGVALVAALNHAQVEAADEPRAPA